MRAGGVGQGGVEGQRPQDVGGTGGVDGAEEACLSRRQRGGKPGGDEQKRAENGGKTGQKMGLPEHECDFRIRKAERQSPFWGIRSGGSGPGTVAARDRD